jgi:ribosomal-protein-alanine N-acetyltransferase
VTVGPPLEGERLILRDLEPADAGGRYLEWMGDPEVMKYLESRFTAYAHDDLLAYIQAARQDPAVRLLGIVRREDGRHIGNLKLGPIDHQHGRADIGILIGERDCWGKGYGTEAVATVSAWAFTALALRKLTAGAYSSNVGSIRAFQRAGFHVEATRSQHYVSGDQIVDAVLLARFRPGLPDGPAPLA